MVFGAVDPRPCRQGRPRPEGPWHSVDPTRQGIEAMTRYLRWFYRLASVWAMVWWAVSFMSILTNRPWPLLPIHLESSTWTLALWMIFGPLLSTVLWALPPFLLLSAMEKQLVRTEVRDHVNGW
jgi:hypothetical protein